MLDVAKSGKYELPGVPTSVFGRNMYNAKSMEQSRGKGGESSDARDTLTGILFPVPLRAIGSVCFVAMHYDESVCGPILEAMLQSDFDVKVRGAAGLGMNERAARRPNQMGMGRLLRTRANFLKKLSPF